jgi:hypothetical protein
MKGPESDGIALQHCRAWLAWAAVQVDQCLADDKPACDQLLRSLREMLERASAATSIDQSTSEVVVAMQSHDRVMQRLTHVSESLRMLHEHLGDARRAQSPDSWRQLHEQQVRAFSMAEERALFTRIVAPDEGGGREIAAGSGDSVEPFLFEDGLEQP